VLAALTDAGLRHLLSTSALVEVEPGIAVIRRWDADRTFYVILAGRFAVDVDGTAAGTLGPGDFFGELAARDWGAGYSYARLATVTCVAEGRVLAVPDSVFRALLEQEPGLRATIERAVGERLRLR
jgi:CRP-like cAMP-binding protein